MPAAAARPGSLLEPLQRSVIFFPYPQVEQNQTNNQKEKKMKTQKIIVLGSGLVGEPPWPWIWPRTRSLPSPWPTSVPNPLKSAPRTRPSNRPGRPCRRGQGRGAGLRPGYGGQRRPRLPGLSDPEGGDRSKKKRDRYRFFPGRPFHTRRAGQKKRSHRHR